MTITHTPDGTGRTGIWRIIFSIVFISGLAVLLAACASSNTPKLILWNHPLVDRIWDVQRQEFIDKAELVRQMRKTEYLLLGERHDNRVAHQHQAWVIKQLQPSHRRVSVAFEMIDDKQGDLLAKQRITSAEQLIAILEHVRNHWDYEHRYKDLFAQVITAGYQIVPANLNRQRLKQLMQKTENTLPPAYKKMLVQTPLPVGQMKSLQGEIKQSHCNMLGEAAVNKMVMGQRLRDAVMAHSLTKSRAPMKVLIAGAGHVRRDRGVPLYLARQDRTARILTIGFVEVSAGANTARQYAERWETKALPFDIVWFTPQVERGNLCADFKALHKGRTSGKASP